MKKAFDFRMRLATAEGIKKFYPEPIPEFAPYLDKYPGVKERCEKAIKGEVIMDDIHGGILITDNEYFLNICETFPDNIYSLINISPSFWKVNEHHWEGIKHHLDMYTSQSSRFVGVNLTPFMLQTPINQHFNMYNIHEYCQENNLIVVIHSSIHYDTTNYWLKYETPAMFDEICTDFPNLTVIAEHAMNPFWDQAMYLAQRHPNLYLSLSSIPAKILPGRVVKAMNTWLRYKFLWGTNFPLMPFESVNDYHEIANEDVMFNNVMRIIEKVRDESKE